MKSSCSPTTLPPWYPTPVPYIDPHTIPLPAKDEELAEVCRLIDDYLDGLWSNYLTYCELVQKPESTKIFAIIFREMDYFEIIKGRAIDKMADKTAMRGILW